MKYGIFSGTISQLRKEVRKKEIAELKKEADRLSWEMKKALNAWQSDRRALQK